MRNRSSGKASRDFIDIVERALTNKGLKYSRSKDSNFLSFSVVNDDLKFDVTVYCGVRYLAVTAEFRNSAAEDKYQRILNTINLINLKMPVGSFQLDPADGTVAGRVGLYAIDGPPSQDNIVHTVYGCVALASKFAPEIMAAMSDAE